MNWIVSVEQSRMGKETEICPFLLMKSTLDLATLHLTKCIKVEEVSEENRNGLCAGIRYRMAITYEIVHFSVLMWNYLLYVVPSSYFTPQITQSKLV